MSGSEREQFDPYRVLGLPLGASKQQIRRQYRRLARRLHPDLRRDDPAAHEEMVRLNRAYQILMDDRLRAEWEARAAAQWIGPLRPSQTAEQALIKAQQLFEAGRLDEAKMACADVLDADPRCAEAYVLLGRIYMREGLDQLAREMYRQAEQLSGRGRTAAGARGAAHPGRSTAAAGPHATYSAAQPPAGTAQAKRPTWTAAPRELWVPEPVRVRWPIAIAGCAAAVAAEIFLLRGYPALWRIVLAMAAGAFTAAFSLADSGAIEPADAVLDEPVWETHGRGAPLWLVMLVAGAAWGHLALIFYLVVGYLGECLRMSAGIFFLAVYAAAAIATLAAPAAAVAIWLGGINAAVVAGILGWMLGSVFSPHEWWRAMP